MTEELSSFDSFDEDLTRGIQELGWSEPMPVQSRVIPLFRKGGDVIVQAITGSGKTGAFGLPIVEAIDPEMHRIQALILAPTRELASQIAKEISVLATHRGIEATAIYGGTAYGPQLDALARGAQVIAGTPGRILDHLKSGRMKLDSLKALIFDEADELLSLGFWPDMREIRSFVPDRRQTGLFSATMPERVRSLARTFLHEPEFVSLTEGGVRSPDEIEHYHYIVTAQEKPAVLVRILEYENPDSAIIFCNTRDDVRYVNRYLQRHHLDSDMIQGEMAQTAREKVMARIKAGSLRFLVATDVAARGIDISDLSHVITYTASDSPEIYLHRTGRTGRAGKTGTAISLVSGLDIANFRSLQKVNRMVIPERAIPTQADVSERAAQRVQISIEHELRDLPEAELALRQDEFLPTVEHLAASEEGRRDLAAVLYAYLRRTGEVAPLAEVPAEPAEERSDSGAGADGGRRRKPRRKRRL